MDNILIQADNLHKSFKDNHAVNGVSLHVEGGEIYGLVGPDGAGKTTLTRLLCGALHTDAGQIHLAGYDLSKHIDEARQQIGYLAQRFSLYEELSVLENLQFFAEVRGLPVHDWEPRSREILQFVGLLEFSDRLAGMLSGGMKQKLGLALALINKPRILLLDEPTTGVDPGTRQDFWKLIIRLLQEENPAVLVSTPYMDEAARCNRVGFMRCGSIICEGTPRELRSQLSRQIIELSGGSPAKMQQLALEDSDVQAVQRFGNRYHLRVNKGKIETVIERLQEKIKKTADTKILLQEVEPQLEDVFIALSENTE